MKKNDNVKNNIVFLQIDISFPLRRETKTGSDFNYCSKLNLSAGVEKSLETEKTC